MWRRFGLKSQADADVVRMLCGIPAGFPLYYIAPRTALPWGDSAYVTCHPELWPATAPHPVPGWCYGPPPGFTPSSEGPRRRPQVMDRITLLQRVRAGLLALS